MRTEKSGDISNWSNTQGTGGIIISLDALGDGTVGAAYSDSAVNPAILKDDISLTQIGSPQKLATYSQTDAFDQTVEGVN